MDVRNPFPSFQFLCRCSRAAAQGALLAICHSSSSAIIGVLLQQRRRWLRQIWWRRAPQHQGCSFGISLWKRRHLTRSIQRRARRGFRFPPAQRQWQKTQYRARRMRRRHGRQRHCWIALLCLSWRLIGLKRLLTSSLTLWYTIKENRCRWLRAKLNSHPKALTG